MATQGIEEVTENAIRAVARDCGSLSMECSDVAGYVQDVAGRIGDHLKMLDGLEEVTTRLLADQARVSDSTDEARLLSEQVNQQRNHNTGKSQCVKSNTPTVVLPEPATEKKSETSADRDPGRVDGLHRCPYARREIIAQQRQRGWSKRRFANTNHHATDQQRPEAACKSG